MKLKQAEITGNKKGNWEIKRELKKKRELGKRELEKGNWKKGNFKDKDKDNFKITNIRYHPMLN